MKLTVKTIKGEVFKIDVESFTTIYQIKEKIFQTKQFQIECQKLIQKGNVIQDNKTVADYNMKEGDFVAPQKPVIAEKPQEEAKQEVNNQKSNEMEEEKKNIIEQEQQQQPKDQPKPIEVLNPKPQQADLSMKFVTGSAYDQAIQEILAMGFNKPDVVQAMMAAYNNPDRAIDYLINGIPQLEQDVLQLANQYDYNELAGQQANGPNQEENARIQGSQSEESSNNPMDQEIQENNQETYVLDQSNPLYFLASNPIFLQLKQQIQNNPQLLTAILSQLQQSNQQLYQLISDNQQEFLRLIHSNVQIQGQQQSQQEELGSQNSGSQNSEGSGQNSSAVSEEDEEAIQRLCQLGFSREIVLQAFMLCGKDENMAANYLFEIDIQGLLFVFNSFFQGNNQQQQQQMQE